MARTLLNGAEQIASGTISWDRMASGAIVPITSIVNGSKIILSDGTVSMAAALNMGGFAVQNAASPTNGTDAATKAYVDAKVMGFSLFGAKAVSISNIAALSGLSAVDGVTPVAGNILLLTGQTTQSQNGPWVAASGSWTRPSWWPAAGSVPEGAYFIADPDGTTYKNTKWWCQNTGTITVDTTAVTFLQDSSGTSYTNGTGLNLAGNTFSVIYGSTSSTAAQGNDSRITGALQTSALGTGVQAALGNAVTGSGSVVCATSPTISSPTLSSPALGTPASGTLTNCTGLPTSGLTGTLAAAQFPALTGDVTTTGGSLSATVNNTSGTGFVKYGNFIWNETPTGSCNGSNTSFGLANAPANSGAALELLLNGISLQPGSGNDFTISGSTITMLFAPITGDKLSACYLK